jgi:membrane protein YdbS with pleckstrin-like domain
MVTPNYTGMGMHMYSGSFNNSTYYYFANLITFLIIILVIIVVVMALFKLFMSPTQKKCKKCGLAIDSDRWQICPRCGNNLQDGSVDKK